MSTNDENEVTMEDSTPEVKNDNGPKATTQNSTGPRPVPPSGIKISDDFIYENIQLISELNAFQSQLEYLHNCMQAASSSDKDSQLVAQTNALVQKKNPNRFLESETPAPKVGKSAPKVPPKSDFNVNKQPMPIPPTRTQPPAIDRRNFSDVIAGRASNLTPPTEAPLNQSAMEFFKARAHQGDKMQATKI
ncbi:hypothetical protein CDAR_181111 [Caerostris darwini]|uniref:Uncharacterized protein n=1 Tax=Caerostris darwini TaxID=1538125 RepID=A0AAV4U3X4_9ARAC|nr:hypothetical protein CDAR_181111 [Caerostris darwini]